MNIMILDTETISVQKKYCYNIGYIIYDTDGKQVLAKEEFVVEQVWHNRPLFDTAYYADKRPLYVAAMRGKKATLAKYGHIQRKMSADIKHYNVQGIYAFNSAFDDEVLEFNANIYGCHNSIDSVPVYDIRGYAVEHLMTDGYKQFCNANEKKKFITPADGYKTTAESFYCYLTNNPSFAEEHTALADCEIELEILKECIERGATWQTEYMVARCFPRNSQKTLTVKVDGKVDYQVNFTKKVEREVADGMVVSLR